MLTFRIYQDKIIAGQAVGFDLAENDPARKFGVPRSMLVEVRGYCILLSSSMLNIVSSSANCQSRARWFGMLQ
jgi:hypothetical protein